MAPRALIVLLGLAGMARAEPAPDADLGFVWQAPAGCPDADGVRARIAQRLTPDQAATIHGITVEIIHLRGEFVAHVDLRGITVANDVRSLSAPRCDDLTDAVAVIVARVAAELLPPARPAAVRVAPRTMSFEPAAEERLDTPGEVIPGDWGGGLHTIAVSGIGGVPAVGLGGEIAGILRHHERFLELGLARWAARDVMGRADQPPELAVNLTTSVVRVGSGPAGLPIRLWLGGEAGTMSGKSLAIGDHTALWLAASAGVGIVWPVSAHVRIVGSFEVVVPVARPRFTLADGSEVYQVSAMSNRAAFGLEFAWR